MISSALAPVPCPTTSSAATRHAPPLPGPPQDKVLHAKDDAIKAGQDALHACEERIKLLQVRPSARRVVGEEEHNQHNLGVPDCCVTTPPVAPCVVLTRGQQPASHRPVSRCLGTLLSLEFRGLPS